MSEKKQKYMYFSSIVQPDPDSFDINIPSYINEQFSLHMNADAYQSAYQVVCTISFTLDDQWLIRDLWQNARYMLILSAICFLLGDNFGQRRLFSTFLRHFGSLQNAPYLLFAHSVAMSAQQSSVK